MEYAKYVLGCLEREEEYLSQEDYIKMMEVLHE